MAGLMRPGTRSAVHGRALAGLLLLHLDRPRPFVHLPVWLCRLLAIMAASLLRRPPLTGSAIAGVVNDANLDPAEAMRDLGYAPLGVRAGFARCFPISAAHAAFSANASQLAKGTVR